jgi:hypothetical protein
VAPVTETPVAAAPAIPIVEKAAATRRPPPVRERAGGRDRPRPAERGPAPAPERPAPERIVAREQDRFADRDRPRRFRDDDLGPPVTGFGDEVPSFMLASAHVTEETELDA